MANPILRELAGHSSVEAAHQTEAGDLTAQPGLAPRMSRITPSEADCIITRCIAVSLIIMPPDSYAGGCTCEGRVAVVVQACSEICREGSCRQACW